MIIEERKENLEKKLAEINQQANALVQQRNQIDQGLNDLNVEALKIQGQLELIEELYAKENK